MTQSSNNAFEFVGLVIFCKLKTHTFYYSHMLINEKQTKKKKICDGSQTHKYNKCVNKRSTDIFVCVHMHVC